MFSQFTGGGDPYFPNSPIKIGCICKTENRMVGTRTGGWRWEKVENFGQGHKVPVRQEKNIQKLNHLTWHLQLKAMFLCI